MREIKFRLIRDGKIVGYEKWIDGVPNKDTGYWADPPRWFYSRDGRKWSTSYIYHDSKEQFTGFLDRNDVEIFEGDIVEIHMGHYNQPSLKDRIPIVWGGPWDKAGFGLSAKRCTHEQCHSTGEPEYTWDLLNPQYAKACEVIGNIHENPELLEKP